jgi:hypothetical protein
MTAAFGKIVREQGRFGKPDRQSKSCLAGIVSHRVALSKPLPHHSPAHNPGPSARARQCG